MTDSQYGSDGIEEALKEAFGSERDMSTTHSNRTRVAVTATTTNSQPCIFTSYNSGRVRPVECGMYQPHSIRRFILTRKGIQYSGHATAKPGFGRRRANPPYMTIIF